jgi:hypothetical protein
VVIDEGLDSKEDAFVEGRQRFPRTLGGEPIGDISVAKDKIFIEPRGAGGFGAKHGNGQRAVVTGPTQREVINQVKDKYPGAEVHVARVRDVGPGPDKFRKV